MFDWGHLQRLSFLRCVLCGMTHYGITFIMQPTYTLFHRRPMTQPKIQLSPVKAKQKHETTEKNALIYLQRVSRESFHVQILWILIKRINCYEERFGGGDLIKKKGNYQTGLIGDRDVFARWNISAMLVLKSARSQTKLVRNILNLKIWKNIFNAWCHFFHESSITFFWASGGEENCGKWLETWPEFSQKKMQFHERRNLFMNFSNEECIPNILLTTFC